MWQGPLKSGITQSALAKFTICRDRFWQRYVAGWIEDRGFNPKIEFGSLVHLGLEERAKSGRWDTKTQLAAGNAMRDYARKLKGKYPSAVEEIDKWLTVSEVTVQVYADFWAADDSRKVFIEHEKPFAVWYDLPSGRQVLLRGKRDNVYLPSRKSRSVYLTDHKSKGYVDDEGLQLQLSCDLQTMYYTIALQKDLQSVLQSANMGPADKYTVSGFCYDLIKRPLSQYSIRQRKGETPRQFLSRLSDLMHENPENYFTRFHVEITQADIIRFRNECFNPLLEQLCDWWESIEDHPNDPWRSPLHWRRPFGIWDGMADGMRGDYFDLIVNGSTAGLVKAETLFPELEE